MAFDPTALSTRTAPPGTPLGRFGATMPLAAFGLNLALLTPVVVTLALKVEAVAPDTKERDLGIVLGIGAFLALVSNPLAGRLSDRTASRYGMRKPWLLGGTLLGALGLVVVATADDVLMIGIGWCVTQVAYNGALAALSATLPDQVPSARRGAISGLVGITTLLSIVVGSLLTAVLDGDLARFLVPALIALALVGLFVFVLSDRVAAGRPAGRLDLKAFLGSFVFDPRRYPDFGWAWLTRFTFVFAAATGLTYLPFFLSDELGIPTDEVPGRVAIATVAAAAVTILTSVLGGFFSDRLGRRKPFVVVAALVAMVGLIVVALSGSFTQLLIGEIILGLGTGCFYAVDLALITEVLPSADDVAKDLGVINMANALPQSLAPAIAPVFLAIGGYPLLFVAGAVVGIVGALLVTRIRSVA
ncbi:MFS transporter [Cryptosporangium aurantiacum]|uniref:Na+/melibiose symporter n=1 Tax=Cryptosporangium aurantiacum TaxID=134849 RepID=A0A1M7RJ81_9ACTN|nr:MFS transporter [Cryptosporangium aurantiacum]SHN46240.1 Na+/melibiose symporter [Cryptosporangium aurantiacum]